MLAAAWKLRVVEALSSASFCSASFCILSAGRREEGFIYRDRRDLLSSETTCDTAVNDSALDAVAAN
jgi:hypothetical protein